MHTRSVRPSLPSALLACGLLLSLAACSGGPAAPVTTAPAKVSENASVDAAPTVEDVFGDLALTLGVGDNAITGRNWSAAVNGYGPIEINKSNGEATRNDGRVLTLQGKTYAAGYGVHALSRMTFAVGGKCRTLTADIGVDDEVGARGSVAFQVFGDGVKLYDSGTMTGDSATKSISVDVAGRRDVQLVVTDGGDGNYHDHADWATPMLRGCEAAALTVTAPAPAPTPTPTPAPTPAPAPAYGAPITITKGGTYTGAWESLDPNVPVVNVQTTEPVVIENCQMRGRGTIVRAYWVRANVTVRNCRAEALNPNDPGRIPGRFFAAEEFESAIIENNTLVGTSGMYFCSWMGRGTVRVQRNLARNIDGRYSDGQGGFQQRSGIVQFVQFNTIRDISGVVIAWNRVENAPRASAVEDTINLYATSGTAASPVRVENNLISGAYGPDPAAVYSGGGIMLGDGGGRYLSAENNTVLETSNYGIAVAGGNDMSVKNNVVLGTGKLADGTFLDADPDAGIYVRDYSQDPAHVAASVVASGNFVGWGRPRAGSPNNRWDYGINASAGTSINNTQVSPNNMAIDPALLTKAVADWEARALAAGITVGSK